MREYYDLRAPEYDEWWHGAANERDGWREELDAAVAAVNALPAARTLDVACGTGYVTRRLTGDVVGVDQSARMLAIAREQAPKARFVEGDALELPFADASFDRVFTSYFFCHLEADDAARFRREAMRVAHELVVLGSRWSPGEEKERWEQRRLSDGSTWPVFKRVFDPGALAAELGGRVVHAGTWFVVVRA
ncbi:MAG TPA: class I SAM-dependent methyltransferase [Gaiellaceae bacterium]